MYQTRRIISALFLSLALLLAFAVPTGAAPDGVPGKPQLLTMDPVPNLTEQDSLVLSGIVLGTFEMELRHGSELISFQADGRFAVTVDLTPGVNYFALNGVDPTGRQVSWYYALFHKTPPTALSIHQFGPALTADGASVTTVTAFARDVAGNVSDFLGPLTFESSDPAVVEVITPFVQMVNGEAVATLRAGTMPGTAVITVTSPDLTAAQLTVTVTAP
ncbi:MAG: hypothetical protein ACM3VW_01725 [Bacteroidota bacterium]